MLDFVKQHPYMSAGGVFVVGAVLMVILFSGGEASATTVYAQPDNSSAVANATALQLATIESQTQIAGINANASTSAAAIAAQLEAAKLEYMRGGKADELSSAVAMAQITSNSETQKLISTLSANVQMASLDTQEALAQVSASTTVQMANIAKSQMTELASTYSNMLISQTHAQNDRELGLASIAAHTELTLPVVQADLARAETDRVYQQNLALRTQARQKLDSLKAAYETPSISAARKAQLQEQIQNQRNTWEKYKALTGG